MVVVKSYSFETIITNSINQGYCTLYHLSSKFKVCPQTQDLRLCDTFVKCHKKPTTYGFTFFYVQFKVKRTRIPSFCGAFSFEIKHKLKLVVYSLHYIFCLSAQLYFILTFFPLNHAVCQGPLVLYLPILYRKSYVSSIPLKIVFRVYEKHLSFKQMIWYT